MISKTIHGPSNHDMRAWRQENKKPLEFDIIHKWVLSEYEKQFLSVYLLSKLPAGKLACNLDNNKGMIRKDNQLYIPIYNNCSRFQIQQDASSSRTNKLTYWISYRKLAGDNNDLNPLAIAVIQKDSTPNI